MAATMNQEIAERVQKVMAKHLRKPVEEISLDATFEQLGMDSLDSVNLLFEVEDEFDISIDDQEAKAIKSIPEMVAGVEALLKRKGEASEPAPPTA
jgi:acyl carrier protein